MARRRRKGRGKKSKAIPVLPVAAVALPAMRAYGAVGATKELPKYMLWEYVGIRGDGAFDSAQMMKGAVPIILAIIGHKVANKTGINRYVKKATFGWLTL